MVCRGGAHIYIIKSHVERSIFVMSVKDNIVRCLFSVLPMCNYIYVRRKMTTGHSIAIRIFTAICRTKSNGTFADVHNNQLSDGAYSF